MLKLSAITTVAPASWRKIFQLRKLFNWSGVSNGFFLLFNFLKYFFYWIICCHVEVMFYFDRLFVTWLTDICKKVVYTGIRNIVLGFPFNVSLICLIYFKQYFDPWPLPTSKKEFFTRLGTGRSRYL